MVGNRLDRRRIKRHHSYTVEEAARTIGASKGTVRRWLDKGLHAIRDRKPYLIRGDDLAAYMARKTSQKRSCPPGACYCVKCRDVREPAGGIAEFVPINRLSGNLRALCPACGSLMHRRTSTGQLSIIRTFLDVAIVERPPRLNDSDQASLNDHLGKD